MTDNSDCIKLFHPHSELDFHRYYELRWRILRAPWQQPLGSEKDELEPVSIHLMACKTARIPAGVCRLHFNTGEQAQIRYMAVDENERYRGIGRLLLQRLEQLANERGANAVILNAREPVVGFYERNGYQISGPGHTLYQTIHHLRMIKHF